VISEVLAVVQWLLTCTYSRRVKALCCFSSETHGTGKQGTMKTNIAVGSSYFPNYRFYIFKYISPEEKQTQNS